jgi:aspartate aminotransferase
VRSISTLAGSIQRSGIRELVDAAREMGDGVIHLEIGEPSFTTPAHIIEAAFEKAAAGATGYTQSSGVLPLRQAIADRYTEKWGTTVTLNMVMASHGGINAINAAVFALCDEGDEVLIPDPAWPTYKLILQMAGAKPMPYPTSVESGFAPDSTAMEALITPRTKMIVTCNPGNPTGVVWTADEVRAVVELAATYDLFVLSDEMYEDLVFEGEHVPAAHFDDDGRVISVSGFSKTYAMTGWRLGWAIAEAGLLASITKLLEPMIACPSSVSQQAGIAALRGTQQPVAVMRDAYRKRRDIAVEILEPAGMLPVRPRGAFYAIADLRETGMCGKELALAVLQEQRVATAPGDTFGEVLANGYLRLSLASSDEAVAEGCRRLIAFRDEHRQ